jgi:hypothetical protein
VSIYYSRSTHQVERVRNETNKRSLLRWRSSVLWRQHPLQKVKYVKLHCYPKRKSMKNGYLTDLLQDRINIKWTSRSVAFVKSHTSAFLITCRLTQNWRYPLTLERLPKHTQLMQYRRTPGLEHAARFGERPSKGQSEET